MSTRVRRHPWFGRNPCLNDGGRPKRRYRQEPVATPDKQAYICSVCGGWHIGRRSVGVHPTKFKESETDA